MNYNELINTAVDVGYLLVVNGAEIYRVEESMQRIFRAYGVTSGEVFAIPNFINATISTPDGRPITKIKRIESRNMDMDKVNRINELCRRICRDTPDFSFIQSELECIRCRTAVPFFVQVAAYACIAAFFTLFYGGTFPDAFVALFCGFAIKIVLSVFEKFHANLFFINIAASFAAAAVALIFAHADYSLNYDKIIIGALMNLVPGIAITGFMRDIIAGDLIAGILRFTESLLVASAIAIGAGIALTATRMLWGV